MTDLPRLSDIDDSYEPVGKARGDEVEAEPEIKKKGRPKNENFLSFNDARDFIREEMIPSRSKFEEWWDRNKPKAIPRFPYRVYKEWQSWNDFLGTSNEFNTRKNVKYRSLNDSILWVHKLKLRSYREWMEFCKSPSGDKPDDIPARPDLVYDNWRSWNHWLGSKPVPALEAQREAIQNSQVYFIIRSQDVPQNVITYGVDPNGISSFKERWLKDKFDIIAMFWNDSLRSPVIKQIVEAFSSPYLGQTNQRITPNVYEIVTRLQQQLQQITPKDVN